VPGMLPGVTMPGRTVVLLGAAGGGGGAGESPDCCAYALGKDDVTEMVTAKIVAVTLASINVLPFMSVSQHFKVAIRA